MNVSVAGNFLSWLKIASQRLPIAPTLLLAAFCILASLSIIWSSDWRTSLYLALHFWLIYLLILSFRTRSDLWKTTMFGLCVALIIQVFAGFIGFAAQSTAFLEPLNMKWPGMLAPSTPGAVVIPLSDGTRVLRAYGTLPHPNILGGFMLISLLGPASLFLLGEKPNYFALILFGLGIGLFALTFSRSAWVGLLAASLILILKSRLFDRKRLGLLLIIAVLSFVTTLLPHPELILARTVSITAKAEKFSFIGRAWLSQEAFQRIQEQPLTGIGIGSFIIDLSQRAGEGYIIEPVHNIFLSAGAELGVPGLLLVFCLFIFIALNMVRAQSPRFVIASAAVAGLGIISLFDHYLWTIAPGRVLLGFVLGLWVENLRDLPSPSGNTNEI